MMKLDAKGAKYARFTLRGCLTRLALSFDPLRKYSGFEVQNILVGAVAWLEDKAETQVEALPQEPTGSLIEQTAERGSTAP